MRAPILLAVVAGALVAVSAQDPQPATPQAPAFRSGVELVRLDVRVTDADERPIRDLRAEEVEIFEEGQPRPIVLFQHIEQPVGTYADVAQRTISSEVSTNQGAPRGHVYVLIFDQLHIMPGNEQRARQAAERFLRARVRPGDRIALYGLPGPGPQIDFTSDTTRAIQQLVTARGTREEMGAGSMGAMRVYEAYEITRGNQDILGRYVQQLSETRAATDVPAPASRPGAVRDSENPAVMRRLATEDARTIVSRADADARRFLLMLADVVRALRDVEGRKSVILFSEGFEIDNVRRELEDVAGAAAQSYSVVYALDLNQATVPLTETEPLGGQRFSEIRSRLESIGSLASDTDGVLFNDATPQLDRILNRISAAAEDYYLIGFAPAAGGTTDRDQYRRVRVAIKRAGARVNARSGYALGPARGADDARRMINAALRAPFSQQGLRVEYTTYVLRGTAPGLQRVVMSLAAELPVATMEAPPAELVFAVRSVADGRLAASGGDTLPLPDATRSGATTGTGFYRVQFELAPGVYLMRAVVREPGGLIGSADRRFSVRSLGGPGVEAGDLVIGSSDSAGLPVRATVYASETLSGVMELYGRTAAQIEPVIVDVSLLPLGSTAALVSGRAELQEVRTGALGSSRGARIDLPLEGVAPGQYLVRAVVRSGRESAAEVLRDVIVAPGSRPAVAVPAPRAVDPAAVLEGEIARRYLGAIKGRKAGPLDARVLEGFARFERCDYASAAATWSQCFEAGPTNAPLAFLLGWARAGAGDERAAIGAWRAAIVADSALVPAYLALIDAYLRIGQPDLARQVAESGVRALPDSLELRDRLLRLGRR
jgi:VWFA-related protein